jgi:hypothetical protein
MSTARQVDDAMAARQTHLPMQVGERAGFSDIWMRIRMSGPQAGPKSGDAAEGAAASTG